MRGGVGPAEVARCVAECARRRRSRGAAHRAGSEGRPSGAMNETRTVAASTLETSAARRRGSVSTPRSASSDRACGRDPGGEIPAIRRTRGPRRVASGRTTSGSPRRGGGRRSTTSNRRMTGRRRDSEACRQRRVELVGPTEHPRPIERGCRGIDDLDAEAEGSSWWYDHPKAPGPGSIPCAPSGHAVAARCRALGLHVVDQIPEVVQVRVLVALPRRARGPPGPAPGAVRRVSRRARTRRRRRRCRRPAGTACRTGAVAPIRHRATRVRCSRAVLDLRDDDAHVVELGAEHAPPSWDDRSNLGSTI